LYEQVNSTIVDIYSAMFLSTSSSLICHVFAHIMLSVPMSAWVTKLGICYIKVSKIFCFQFANEKASPFLLLVRQVWHPW